MYEQYKNNVDDVEKYGIQITYAGKYFLNICPEFEYFACRYKPNKSLIFCDSELKSVLLTIKDVKRQTFRCVDHIMGIDKALLSTKNSYNFNALYSEDNGVNRCFLYKKENSNYMTNKTEQHHVLRIVDSHISYIDMYRIHVLNMNNITDDEKRYVSNELLNILQEYVNKLKSIAEISAKCGNIDTYYLGDSRRTNGKIKYRNLVDYKSEYE